MKKSRITDRISGAEIKTDRGREQNQKRQARFDQFGKIGNSAKARPLAVSRNSRDFTINRRRFHVTSAPPALNLVVDLSTARPCKIRQQIAQLLTPKDSMIAPTATCAVAISAALLLQIVQAPSVIWQATNATQKIDNRLSAVTLCASLPTRRQNATTA